MSDVTESRLERFNKYIGIFIALVSLGLSMYAIYSTHAHNRLSVRPKLTLMDYNSSEDPIIGIELFNKGTGPALIQKWEIHINNELVGAGRPGWRTALNRLNISQPWVHFATTDVLESGKSLRILWVSQDEWKELSLEHRQAFRNALRQIKLSIDYTSVYNQAYSLDSFLVEPGERDE
jgi:hypothetical protein